MRKKEQTQQFATLLCLITAPSLLPARTGRNHAAAFGRDLFLDTPKWSSHFWQVFLEGNPSKSLHFLCYLQK